MDGTSSSGAKNKESDTRHSRGQEMRQKNYYRKQTNPFGLAKRCLLGEGLIVPVEDAEEAEEADEESSSRLGSGSGRSSSSSCSSYSSSSIRDPGGIGGLNGRPASLALAKAR